MNDKNHIKFKLLLLVLFFLLPIDVRASSISDRLQGKILLQVEENGEAWYVGLDKNRYFLGDPKNAFNLMRDKGVGISNSDLTKIPIGFVDYSLKNDTDKDGLSDEFENAIGTSNMDHDSDNDSFTDKQEVMDGFNPMGKGKIVFDHAFSEKKKGIIFLQVEKNGEAWYVNPEDSKRYFLGKPSDAFMVMRTLGLGISNVDLEKITIFGSPFSNIKIEKIIFDRINTERRKAGLSNLVWSDNVADVAREHSQNLSEENKQFASSMGKKCDLPIIHHQGLDFGLYQDERLKNRDYFNFDKSAENIALISSARFTIKYYRGDGTLEEIDECKALKNVFDKSFYEQMNNNDLSDEKKVEVIKKEIKRRAEAYENYFDFENVEVNWDSEEESVNRMISGWMNSPGHKKNILTSDFDETGVGIAYTDGGYLISTQVFTRNVY